MAGAGMLMILLALAAAHLGARDRLADTRWFVRLLPVAILLPYLANTAGWLLAELGRQPWIVYGVMKTEDAVSPNVTAGMVLATLALFTAVYGVLMVVDLYLLRKYAVAGPAPEGEADHALEY